MTAQGTAGLRVVRMQRWRLGSEGVVLRADVSSVGWIAARPSTSQKGDRPQLAVLFLACSMMVPGGNCRKYSSRCCINS